MRTMSKLEKKKLLVLFAGILSFAGIFWMVLCQIEKTLPLTKTEQEIMASSNTSLFEAGGAKTEPVGSITLYGKKYYYFHEIETYLLIGTDGSGNERVAGEKYQGSMADFLLLVIINKSDQTYRFLQLNRDTMTEVTLMQRDGTGMASADIQICTAHWYGGSEEQSCENTVEAVSKLLGGIKIDGYYALNMQKIPILNHTIGGVKVTMESDFSHIDTKMKKGSKVLLTDEQAYHFIHDRYGIGDGENLSRMKRQKQYMQAFLRKAKGKFAKEPDFVGSLYKELQEGAATDMTRKRSSQLANELFQGIGKGFFVPIGTSKVGQALGDGIKHTEFHIQKKSFTSLMIKLYNLKE